MIHRIMETGRSNPRYHPTSFITVTLILCLSCVFLLPDARNGWKALPTRPGPLMGYLPFQANRPSDNSPARRPSDPVDRDSLDLNPLTPETGLVHRSGHTRCPDTRNPPIRRSGGPSR